MIETTLGCKTFTSIAFIAAVSCAAPALGAQPELLPTNLPDVMSVAGPPTGFDPIAASNEDLARYGFPARPNPFADREHYADWARAMRASKVRIDPQLRSDGLFHMPMQGGHRLAATQTSKNTLLPSTSINWSGIANVNGTSKYGPSSFTSIEGEFNIPVARQAFGTCSGGWEYESSWVGIDGYDVNDVLQSGIGSDASCVGGTNSTFYNVWIEWFPNGSTAVTNFPVVAGDDMFITITASSPTSAVAYIVNETTGMTASVQMKPPAGTVLVGDSAEWIVERPYTGTGLSNLSNYITAWFSSTYATLVSGGTTPAGAPGSAAVLYGISMHDNAGSTISTGALQGKNSIVFHDQGSAK